MSKAAKRLDARTPGKTVFQCQSPQACGVFLSGTFNNWDPGALPMERQNDGTWRAELELEPGRYEYKFVVDGAWCCEPGRADGSDLENCIPNPFGTMNCVVEVPGEAAGESQSRTAAQ